MAIRQRVVIGTLWGIPATAGAEPSVLIVAYILPFAAPLR